MYYNMYMISHTFGASFLGGSLEEGDILIVLNPGRTGLANRPFGRLGACEKAP